MNPALLDLHLACGGYRDSTIDSKKRAFKYFRQYIGSLSIADIAYGHAEDFQKMLYQSRAAKSVNLYVVHLTHFFAWAVKRKYISQNPFDMLRRLPEETNRQPVFSDEELVRLFNVAGLNWKVLICLGILGLRETEALNLIVSDLDLESGYILITPKKDTNETWVWGIKNRKQDYAPLPEFITLKSMTIKFHLLIRELIESHPQQPYVCVKPSYYKKLIERKREGKLHYRKRLCPWGNFDRDFKVLLKRALIKPKSFHDLRRTFANKLRNTGFDLKEVQTLMRHQNIQTTAQYYVNIEEQELVAKVNRTFETLSYNLR